MEHGLSPYRACLALLRASYPNAIINQETVDAYEAALRDLDVQAVMDAVAVLVKESKFMPTIAEIREVVAEQALNLPSETEAWLEADARSTGSWDKANHPLVHHAIRAMGGTYGIRTSDAPQITRAQFLKCYRELRAAAIQLFVRTGVAPQMPTIEGPDRLEERDGDFYVIPGGARETAPAWLPEIAS